ncbi:MAG: hypothetical protein PHC36_00065 [Eubacteriales bacterium]|nr:hypothetical protein [Eubacteriales bacterium]MDD4444190.1 hypothetical protein [Eubacteriales bacterium]
MRRMLEELYYGNISPNNKQFIRDTQFDKAMLVLSENEAKLTGLLEGQEKKLFLDLVNAQSEVNGVTAVESFIEGFRLGARIAIEVMNGEDGCLVDID